MLDDDDCYDRSSLKPDLKLLLTLWIIANEKETFRSVSNHFNVSESTAHGIFKEIVLSLSNLKSKYIKWPQGEYDYFMYLIYNKAHI